MGRVVGLEPTHNGATIRRVSHFTTPATYRRHIAFRHMTLSIIAYEKYFVKYFFILPFYFLIAFYEFKNFKKEL